MLQILFTILIIFFSGIISGDRDCQCNEPTLIYETTKCEPIYTSSDNCCPTRYDCSGYEQAIDASKGKCLFNGTYYNIGDQLEDAIVRRACRGGCVCEADDTGETSFLCSYFDCAVPPFPNEKCRIKESLGQCCATKDDVVCPPFATCDVDGRTYQEGEEFTPINMKCTKCVCGKNFKLEAPFCRQETCWDQIDYQAKNKYFCGPSYRSSSDCCPSNWICPDEKDTVIAAPNLTVDDPELKCKYGHVRYNVGDRVERADTTGTKIACECKIPPLLTCIESEIMNGINI